MLESAFMLSDPHAEEASCKVAAGVQKTASFKKSDFYKKLFSDAHILPPRD